MPSKRITKRGILFYDKNTHFPFKANNNFQSKKDGLCWNCNLSWLNLRNSDRGTAFTASTFPRPETVSLDYALNSFPFTCYHFFPLILKYQFVMLRYVLLWNSPFYLFCHLKCLMSWNIFSVIFGRDLFIFLYSFVPSSINQILLHHISFSSV